MSQYYRATGDPSLVLNCQDKINRIFRMMRDNRAENMTRFPKDDPRHGMMTSGFENDIQVQDQYYTSDCGVWVGIRDYAEVLEKIAATPQGGALAAKAKEVKHFSDDLYKSLRTSMDKAGIVRDTAGKPVAFQCSPDVKGEGLKSKYFTVLTPWVVYRRFHGQPRMFAHGFMSDAETVAFLDFQAKHDQTILGVRRWKPAVLDDFVSFEVEYQRLRLDRVREFLMKYFAYLQLQTSVGTWTGFEQTFCDTAKGVKARKPKPDSKTKLHGMNTYEGLHGTIVAPMLTEQMFCFDEPGKDAVWLGAGISTHWLKDGAPLVAKRMGCRYGLVDLAMTWRAADKTLTAEITPTPGRTMTEVRVRFRSPTGKPLTSATLADGIACEIKGDLTILHNVFKPVIVTAHFAE